MLKDNIPQFISNEPQINDLLTAIQPEINSLRQELEIDEKQLYAITTDIVMQRWERDYGLSLDLSLTLEERRIRLLNKIRRKRILNKKGLNALIKATVNDAQFHVVNKPHQYKFIVYLSDMTQKEKLHTTLYYARPAHLIYDIIELIDARRCGTFNCGSNPL